MSWKKTGTIVLGIAVIAGLGYAGWRTFGGMFNEPMKTVYTTQGLKVGSMQSTISATGTVEPEELVNVGAQVGGMITTLGKDAVDHTIDYGSPVKAGMVLAQIDDALYRAEFDTATALLLQAEASKKNAEAGILQAKAKLAEENADSKQCAAILKKASAAWERAKRLEGVYSQSDYDEAEATYLTADANATAASASEEAAKANLAAAQATLQQTEAQIASAKASLSKAKRNLGYCVISSPVDGVIIDRRVNIGQTVNSSMSAPSLFLIAKDLKKMQVWVSVNEADIGQIKVGQKATFTVDAFPDKNFTGEVQKIRLNATMSQNVVTYVVEIGTDNSSLTLLPYLTANVKFILDSRDSVLSVPNAALRFTPQNAPVPQTEPGERIVWVLDAQEHPVPVKVRTGLNDGSSTEIISGNLTPDQQVITGSRTVSLAAGPADGAPQGNSNPFMPQPPKMKGKK